ncbi:hypothetical protein [Saccharothrix australiensis]|uniref:hypothetical protein n=1 Tax=Saccharothrix australiensis TaxID=2072 RepID=UPI000EADD380|nr:hypothetical protein [Saccharothrix australiensis]
MRRGSAGHWGEVVSELTLPIATAHGTLPRRDRVVARTAYGDNRIEFDVLEGTAAESPSAPGVTIDGTRWEVPLAVVDVPALDTVIGATQVGDSRRYVEDSELTARLTADVTRNNTPRSSTSPG